VSALKILRFLALPICSALLCAQDTASLAGVVTDPSNAVVQGAMVTLVETNRGTIRHTFTDAVGKYAFDGLMPGNYGLEFSKSGFSKLTYETVRISIRDRQWFPVRLQIAPVESASVTVTAQVAGVSSDASTGTTVESDFAKTLPLNSRDLLSIVRMTPGLTSAGPGGFNTNGLRSNTNYITVDGVSAGGMMMGGGPGGGPGGPGGPPGGGGPPPGGGGGMISLDAMEDVRVQTSTFAPEFGRTPGAQISVTSRGGGNSFHGSLFEYARNTRFNANDWFGNTIGLSRGATRYNNFGGVVGGPILRNKTYFFASYEGTRAMFPSTILTNVQSVSIRETTDADILPFVNGFPLPNGPALTSDSGRYSAVFSTPSRSDSASLRIDHKLSDRVMMFGRYSVSPNRNEFRGDISPNVISTSNSRSHSGLLSVVWIATPNTTNDFRLNYARSKSTSYATMDSMGGAVPLTSAIVFPSGIDTTNGQFSLNVQGVGGYSIAQRMRSVQDQMNVVDNVTSLKGSHQLKFGRDMRRQAPTIYNTPYNLMYNFNGISEDADSLTRGRVTSSMASSNEGAVYPLFMNFSMYGQDTWSLTRRATVTYGLRWDVNPAPTVRRGSPPIGLTGSSSAGYAISRFNPLYYTRWRDIAPRVGLAYQMDTTPGREMVFRAGLGRFHDVGYGNTAMVFIGAPYSAQEIHSGVSFPIRDEFITAPALPALKPYGRVSAATPTLRSPSIYQWNLSVERMFSHVGALTVSYVGTSGKDLLQMEGSAQYTDDYDMLELTTNGGSSRYNGLQVQLTRRMSKNFLTQFSYTIGHATDTASNDSARGGAFVTLDTGTLGDADYDVRHTLSFSGSVLIPSPKPRPLKLIMGDWWMDWVMSARSATPFSVQGVTEDTSGADETADPNDNDDDFEGMFAFGRPNLTGEQVWFPNVHAPGGRSLNPDAFEMPDTFAQGDLGRNVLRGFPMFQLDLSLRRQIPVGERLRLQIGAQAINVFNHPNFSNPSMNTGANMASPEFGVSTRMLSNGGMGAMQNGGPRSFQMNLRLEF